MGHCLCSHTYSMGLHARFCESDRVAFDALLGTRSSHAFVYKGGLRRRRAVREINIVV